MALYYGLDDQGFESQQGLGIFLFTTESRLALVPTQPSIQWVPQALFLGEKLTNHFNLVPRSRIRGAISPLPNTPSWRGAELNKAEGQLYLTFSIVLQLGWRGYEMHTELSTGKPLGK
jgi:hypothetical protein